MPRRRPRDLERPYAIAPTPNIGPRGQRRRLRFGVMTFGAALALGGVLFALDAPNTWRFALVPLLWLSALGFFQARDKT